MNSAKNRGESEKRVIKSKITRFWREKTEIFGFVGIDDCFFVSLIND